MNLITIFQCNTSTTSRRPQATAVKGFFLSKCCLNAMPHPQALLLRKDFSCVTTPPPPPPPHKHTPPPSPPPFPSPPPPPPPPFSRTGQDAWHAVCRHCQTAWRGGGGGGGKGVVCVCGGGGGGSLHKKNPSLAVVACGWGIAFKQLASALRLRSSSVLTIPSASFSDLQGP